MVLSPLRGFRIPVDFPSDESLGYFRASLRDSYSAVPSGLDNLPHKTRR